MTAPEAHLADDGHGLAPASGGWFVVNLAHARARGSEKLGVWTDLEPPEAFEDYGTSREAYAGDPPHIPVRFRWPR